MVTSGLATLERVSGPERCVVAGTRCSIGLIGTVHAIGRCIGGRRDSMRLTGINSVLTDQHRGYRIMRTRRLSLGLGSPVRTERRPWDNNAAKHTAEIRETFSTADSITIVLCMRCHSTMSSW